MREEMIKQALEAEAARLPQSEAPWEQIRERALSGTKTGRDQAGWSFGRRLAFSTAAAVVLTGGVIGSGFVSPAMASVLKDLPIIGSVFEHSDAADSGMKQASKTNTLTTVGTAVTDKGIKLTLSEVYADDTRFSVAVVAELPEGMNGTDGIEDFTYDLPHYGLVHPLGSMFKWSASGKNVYTGVFQVPSDKMPDDFSYKLNVAKIAGVEGNWSFEVPVSKQKAVAVSKTFDPMITKTSQGTKATVDRITFAPSITTITVKMEGPLVEKMIVNTVGTVKVHRMPEIKFLDQDGKNFTLVHDSKGGTMGGYNYNLAADAIESKFTFDPVKKLPEKLVFQLENNPDFTFEIPLEEKK
jgi:hypothetical protein